MFRHQRYVGGLIVLAGVLFFASRNFLVGLVEGLLLVSIGWASWPHHREPGLRLPPLLAAVAGVIAVLTCGYVVFVSG